MTSNLEENKIMIIKLLKIIETQQTISKKLDHEYISKAKYENCIKIKGDIKNGNIEKRKLLYQKILPDTEENEVKNMDTYGLINTSLTLCKNLTKQIEAPIA